MSLKVGLMPAVDAAPMLLAEEKGYFEELGLEVEFEIFNNAQNRQSALQTNAIDGAVTDLIAVATNVDGGFDLKATMMTEGVFPVLMKKGSEAKKSVKVGMMEVSVTNFLIEQWLGEQYDIEKVFINEIPTRLAAIVSGELDMGVFPEPMASMGALQGLEKKVYGLEDEYCPDVLVFTGKAIYEKERAIQLFHEAYNKAVEDIQKDDREARDILIEKLENISPEIKDDMVLPKFRKATLQDEEYLEKIIRWTGNTIKKDLRVSADDLVYRKFVEQ
ncbi:MAG: ABC transporter substrate-binding protein [Clostridiaceae bacterium]|nr:ABC transporter substrate-binding protein [Clostridiaceae bacterium]